MNNTQKKFNKDLLYLLPSFIILVALFVITYLYSENVLNSDISAELVLAKELIKEGKIFSVNWFYSTEVRIIYTQLISVLLLRFINSWSLVRALMNLICGILVVVSYLYMVKPLELNKKLTYLSTALLLIPFSTEFVLIVQLGNSYMPHYIICFLTLGLMFRLYEVETKKINIILYIIMMVVCGVSGIRYALILMMPIFITTLINYVVERYRAKNSIYSIDVFKDKGMRVSLIGVAGFLIGYLVNMMYFGRYYTYNKYDTLYISDFNTTNFSKRLGTMFADVLRLFGYTDSASIMSFTGIQSLIAIGFVAILVYMVVRVYMGKTPENKNRKYMKVFAVVSLFVNVMVFIFFDYMYEKRYFILVFMFWVPFIVMYFEKYSSEFRELSKTISVLFVSGCVVLSAFNLRMVVVNDENAELQKVAKFLDENNANLGMATYWNGNILTELSDGAVEVINIKEKYFVEPYKWLMHNRLLEQKTWETAKSDNFFLVLSFRDIAEMGLADSQSALELIMQGEKVYDDGGYTIFFYDRETFINTYAPYICVE